MKLRSILSIIVAMSILVVVALGLSFYFSFQSSLKEKALSEIETETKILADHLASSLRIYERELLMLSMQNELRTVLNDQGFVKKASAHAVMDQFVLIVEADVCFLTDADGNIIATTNRYASFSLIGKNIASQPYFQQAMQGEPAIYPTVEKS